MQRMTGVYQKNLPNIPAINDILQINHKEEQPKEGYIDNLKPARTLNFDPHVSLPHDSEEIKVLKESASKVLQDLEKGEIFDDI